ncbi:hypothetical protein [Frankia sp. R82]|nr:hypothetical protein [Frankia sp. R82]
MSTGSRTAPVDGLRFFARRARVQAPRYWLAELTPDSTTFTLVL